MDTMPLAAAGLVLGALLVSRAAPQGTRRAGGGTVARRRPAEGWTRQEEGVRRSSGPWHVVRRTPAGHLVVSRTFHDRAEVIREAAICRQSGRSAAIMDGAAPRHPSLAYSRRARAQLAQLPARERRRG